MLSHAARQHPEEACGLLVGRGSRVTAVVPAPNVAADRRLAFEVDPAVLLRVHRTARAGGDALLGWYHSHPNGEGAPSLQDASRAVEEGRLWLIVAGGTVRAFCALAGGPVHGRFAPCDLVPINDEDDRLR